MRVLITGVAGFIGMHTALALLERGDSVVGVDNINDYYSIELKQGRLRHIGTHAAAQNFQFIQGDVADSAAVMNLFAHYRPDAVIHLAAQVGVRYSVTNPLVYISSNITGFMHILEGCRQYPVQHLVYASSSFVYGANETMPFSVHHNVDHPLSLYAASKKANELMAHSYAHLYQLPTTGLRFFTVYGPWGRPDVALFKFTRAILAGQPIDVYNYGHHRRDFTYIDDIVEGIVRTVDRPAVGNLEWSGLFPDPSSSRAPWRVYNIGNQQCVELLDYIAALEHHLGSKAVLNLLPLQPGDVPDTYADVEDLVLDVGYRPSTSVKEGVGRFVAWYKAYYGASH